MLSIRSVIALLIPSTILGFSFFWWKRKKTYNAVKYDQDSELVLEAAPVNDTKNDGTSPLKRDYQCIKNDNEKDDTFIETRIESVDIDECFASPPVKRKYEEDISAEDDSIIEWRLESVNLDDKIIENAVDEDGEIIVEFLQNPLECDNTEFLSELDKTIDFGDLDFEVTGEKQHSKPILSDSSSQKRVRHQSSCDGDSAFVEDYSSDNISVSGSDSALKSPETSIPDEHLDNSNEEDVKEKNYRNWYGPGLESILQEEESVNWANTPMSDTDNDIGSSDDLLKKTMTIGGVSMDKLSISFEQEEHRVKIGSKSTPKKSRSTPKKRNKREKTNQKNSISTSLPACPKASKKGKRTPKKKRNESESSGKGIEGSWRNIKTENSADESSHLETFEYEFPEEMCGKIIGKSGKHVNEIKQKTGASICIEPEMRSKSRVVSIAGTKAQIKKAEKILNARFENSLVRIIDQDITEAVANLTYISLPVEETVDVIITALVDAGNFFVQIFHPDVDEKLVNLQTDIAGCYMSPRKKYLFTNEDAPQVDDYCAAYIDYTWCRLKIIEIMADNQAYVSYVDYGGTVTLPIEVLMKIRPDLLDLPVQAVECYLSNVVPHENEVQYSYAATNVFSQLVEGKVLQARITGQRNQIPCVELSHQDSQQLVCVNKELEKWGLVRWSDV